LRDRFRSDYAWNQKQEINLYTQHFVRNVAVL
jgi:hypothetical protein